MTKTLNSVRKAGTRIKRAASPKVAGPTKVPTSAKKAISAKGAYCTQSEAAGKLQAIYKQLVRTGGRVYVKDKAGTRYMTLDTSDARVKEPVIDVSLQRFKDNFSAFSNLVRIGICFRVSMRSVNEPIYARPYGSYTHPLSDEIALFHERLKSNATIKAMESNILKALERRDSGDDEHREEVKKYLNEFRIGIARIALGHRPFEEGEL